MEVNVINDACSMILMSIRWEKSCVIWNFTIELSSRSELVLKFDVHYKTLDFLNRCSVRQINVKQITRKLWTTFLMQLTKRMSYFNFFFNTDAGLCLLLFAIAINWIRENSPQLFDIQCNNRYLLFFRLILYLSISWEWVYSYQSFLQVFYVI